MQLISNQECQFWSELIQFIGDSDADKYQAIKLGSLG